MGNQRLRLVQQKVFPKQISAMVPELSKTSGGFLCGNQFSIADIIMTTTQTER